MAPLSMEFSRQEYWSAQTFPSPGDLPNPGIKSTSLALQADSLPSEPPRKSRYFSNISDLTIYHCIFINVNPSLGDVSTQGSQPIWILSLQSPMPDFGKIIIFYFPFEESSTKITVLAQVPQSLPQTRNLPLLPVGGGGRGGGALPLLSRREKMEVRQAVGGCTNIGVTELPWLGTMELLISAQSFRIFSWRPYELLNFGTVHLGKCRENLPTSTLLCCNSDQSSSLKQGCQI